MTNKNNDNVFLNSLRGVKPIKKSNKIIKSLPKPQPLDNKKIVLKNRKTEICLKLISTESPSVAQTMVHNSKFDNDY